MAGEVHLGAGLPPLPEELLLARDRGEVLFVVGAGASYPAPSSLPDFAGLVSDIYRIVDPNLSGAIDLITAHGGPEWNDPSLVLNHQQRTELKFFCRGEYDVALGMLERRIDGDPSRASTMRLAALDVLARTVLPNTIHESLVRLGQRYGKTLLVTTNFDRLLSEAAKQLRLATDGFALGEMPYPSRGSEFTGILHMHGKLAWKQEKVSAVILTDQDFGDHYLRRHLITSFLYDAARIYHLVLVGYSANDSPVRYLLNAIAGDERHFVDLKRRYAFIGCDPSDARTPIEWQSRGITPIAYDRANRHSALSDVLARWADILPEKRNRVALTAKIKAYAALDPESSDGQAAQSFLGYYIRRSTSVERMETSALFAKWKASPKWLSFLNKTMRDADRDQR